MEKEIRLDLIDIPEFDLRYYRSQSFFDMFCEDIAQSGMLVKPIVERTSNNRYRLVDGVNRIKCAKRLKWETVLCDVYDSSNEIERLLIGLKVNLNRSSHDPMGVCCAIERLKSLGMKQKEIALSLGFSKGHVSKLLALNKLDSHERLALAQGKLSIDQAYLMVRKKRDPELMERLGNRVKYRCSICNSKVDFRNYELLGVCSECKRKLEDVLRSEKLKRKDTQFQKALNV